MSKDIDLSYEKGNEGQEQSSLPEVKVVLAIQSAGK
jgi:hypothetical protein